MTQVILIAGGDYTTRETVIANRLATSAIATSSAVILEGMPAGHSILREHADLQLIHLAPSCPCCVGNLVFRVQLNRLLRRKPSCIFLALHDSSHLENTQAMLRQPPYDRLIKSVTCTVLTNNL